MQIESLAVASLSSLALASTIGMLTYGMKKNVEQIGK